MEREGRLIDDRWEEVDRIFAAALELEPDARGIFVANECAGDEALLNTVTELLEATEDAVLTGPGTRVLRAAFGGGAAASSVPRGLASGSRVGPYRIVGELGRGGMATVYEAERADGAFEQRVAVKVLRGVDSQDVSRRFLAERQIMSSLVHPNIARLLDGGTTDDGLPYLVMELVDGEPVTRYADRLRLDVDARVELFLQAAAAVQYAHTRLVVHRDLKPSNVLVAADGTVRLLDFGIAKLLAEDSGDAAPMTRPATRWMTPEYAAPEQVLGAPITTATDVHGLGTLLYELLVGRRPFEGRSGYERERAISEDEPAPPSSVLDRNGRHGGADASGVAQLRDMTPDALRRRLAGDLDAIIGKALRKDPDDRYGSVEELRADLVRQRDGFPVEAREGLRSYRTRKFLLRHRVAAGAAAAFLTVVLLAAGALLRQNAETQRERDRAETEAENAEAVVGFLADVFQGNDQEQAPSDTITARELLAWGAERVDSQFGDRPVVQARLFQVLGNAHANLGLYDRGAELLHRAVAIRRAEFGDTSAATAEALADLGWTLQDSEDGLPAAIPRLEEAVAIYRALPDADERDLARTLSSLAEVLRDGLVIAGGMDRTTAAESAAVVLDQALQIRRRYPSEKLELARATVDLAYLLRAADRLDEAESLYEEGIPILQSHPDHTASELALSLNNLAFLHVAQEEFAAGVERYRAAIAAGSEIWAPGHPQMQLFVGNLAAALVRDGREKEALDVFRARPAAVRDYWPDGHWRVGSAYAALGNALLRNGLVDEADTALREAVRSYTEHLGANHEWTEWTTCRVAVIMILRGEDAARGRSYLDGMRAFHARRRDEGTLGATTAGHVEGFLRVLEAVDLTDEYRRFAELIPEDYKSPYDPSS